jgi:class 3 adenylate cyclase
MSGFFRKISGIYTLLVGNFVLLLLMASMIVLGILLKNLNATISQLSQDRLDEMLTLTQEELKSFFNPITQEMMLTVERANQGLFEEWNLQTFNQYFYPLLHNSEWISSVMVATADGQEYMALDLDSILVNRLTTPVSESETQSKRMIWQKQEDNTLMKIGDFAQEELYDPRRRPWHIKGMASRVNTITWTDPYTFFTTGSAGITSVVKWKQESTGDEILLGFDILLEDISRFTTQLHLSENSKIIVLTKDRQIIGLPNDERFLHPDSVKTYVLQYPADLRMPVFDAAIAQFEAVTPDQPFISFFWQQQIYWLGTRKIPLGPDNGLIIGAIVPESDFFKQTKRTRLLILGGFGLILVFVVLMALSYFQKRKDNRIISQEKEKNEQLLLNTLPAKVVRDLIEKGKSEPERFSEVTVMFIDIVDFTKLTASMDPKLLIDELNEIYTVFDEITEKHQCERIKTIGDAYLAVCGMPQPDAHHADNILLAAFAIRKFMEERNITARKKWQIRIGIHSGRVVGGIIGIKKYLYDIFGDTINTASRFQSYSEPMKINISESTRQLLERGSQMKHQKIRFITRPSQLVKGKGSMDMYYVEKS